MDYWMELFSAMISIWCLQSRGCWFGTDEHQLMEKKNVDCYLRIYFIRTKDNQWPSFVILSVWCNLISCMGFPTFVNMVSVVIVCKLSLILLFLQIVFESFSSDFVKTNKRFFCFFCQSLLCDPNPNSPANSEAARMFSENKREYNRRVREIVEQSWTADWGSYQKAIRAVWWTWSAFLWTSR